MANQMRAEPREATLAKSNRAESKVAPGRADLSARFLVVHRRSLKRFSATPTSVYVAHPELRRCRRAPAKARSTAPPSSRMNCRTLIEEAMRLSTLSFFARLSGLPFDPLCDLFGQEHEHPSNKPGAGLESAVLEPLSPLYQC